MKRREFVKMLGSIPVAMSFAPLIGEVAGGLYVPCPDDLTDYIKWYPAIRPMNQDAWAIRAVATIAWAPLGSTQMNLQMIGGTIVFEEDELPALSRAKQINTENTFRNVWEEGHYPGWLSVAHSVPTDKLDDEGCHVFKTVHRWTRVGNLQWCRADMMSLES